jgi:hypothetical protein
VQKRYVAAQRTGSSEFEHIIPTSLATFATRVMSWPRRPRSLNLQNWVFDRTASNIAAWISSVILPPKAYQSALQLVRIVHPLSVTSVGVLTQTGFGSRSTSSSLCRSDVTSRANKKLCPSTQCSNLDTIFGSPSVGCMHMNFSKCRPFSYEQSEEASEIPNSILHLPDAADGLSLEPKASPTSLKTEVQIPYQLSVYQTLRN